MAKIPRDVKSIELPDLKKTCGIIMPISPIDGCSEHHWQDVSDIISDAIESAGLEANLVSNADEVGFIKKRIVQNLYTNPIVVCDVSGEKSKCDVRIGHEVSFRQAHNYSQGR